MDTIILPEKGSTEILPFTVNFGDRLQYGESINGATTTITVLSGVDPNPNAMISNAPSYTANTVTQIVTGGVVGVIYMLVFLVTGTGSHNYVKEGRLVITQPGAE